MENLKIQLSKAEQHRQYQYNGGLMTMQEWENDSRYDPSLPLSQRGEYTLYQRAGGISTFQEWSKK